MRFIKGLIVISSVLALFSSFGCAPEVGSDEWCADMKEKPKKDWTAAEATDYTKHCLFK